MFSILPALKSIFFNRPSKKEILFDFSDTEEISILVNGKKYYPSELSKIRDNNLRDMLSKRLDIFYNFIQLTN